MTKLVLPKVSIPTNPDILLPFGGELRTNDKLIFSFSCFDRTHKLFNLGYNSSKSGTLDSSWFIDFLDCLKNVSLKKIYELSGKGSVCDLHPVNWENANVSKPESTEQCEFWQFRINKSKGRIIGILIDGIFYIVWLDPHHNLTNSEGYRGTTYYSPGKSEYEKLSEELNRVKEENKKLKTDLDAAESLMEESKKTLI